MKNDCKIEFECIQNECECLNSVSINEIESDNGIVCPECQRKYRFHSSFVEKMGKFSNLIEAVQEAKEILGDTNVAINTKDGEIKIPYRLLLTRMNTLITLKMEGKEVQFRFRVEPLNEKEVIR